MIQESLIKPSNLQCRPLADVSEILQPKHTIPAIIKTAEHSGEHYSVEHGQHSTVEVAV
jgi:hypothetical protein